MFRHSYCLICVFFFMQCTEKKTYPDNSSYATIGSIEVNDPKLAEILNAETKIEILADGFNWSEGPVWVTEGEYLLLSDIPSNCIYKWKESDSISLYLKPSGYSANKPREGESGSNGLMLNAQGQLLLAQHGDRRIAVMDAPLDNPKSNFIGLATSFNGLKFNSPNDLTIHSNGDIYFTDPPYGLEQQMDDPAKEIDFQGVYRWSAQDSSVTLLYSELSRPNGINLSHDEKQLYVANSDSESNGWTVFDVEEGGTISNARVFNDAQAQNPLPGGCDGMDIHPNGMVFATGPGGVWIMDEKGKVLGRIYTESLTANCTFDDTYKTLYMTANNYLLRLKMR